MTVTNNTGRADAVYLYVLGVSLKPGGRLGYVNAAGIHTPWTGGSLPPSPAPDVSIPGPPNGQSVTLRIPRELSGRVYMSFGEKLKFFLSPDGLVQPAPWNPSDPNRNILFDTSEFTYNNAGLWLNSSQVDMFAIPHAVTVTGSTGITTRTGDLVNDGRNRVINDIRNTAGFANTVHTRSDGTVLRVWAPGKAVDSGSMDANYLDPYIASAWNAYTNRTLTVVPFQNEPNTKFFGRTSGNVMNFTNGAGQQVASFTRPSTANVWGCDGNLRAPNDLVVGPIARTLCAALHRSTLGTYDTEPRYSPSEFYHGTITNHYSRIIHANMADGKAYGFAFDDVAAQESLVHDGDPRAAGIIMSPFGAGNPGTGNQLQAGQRLTAGQSLTSTNGRFRLSMQTDGNLVIYDGASPIWATGTWNLPADRRPTRVDMQADGNLVLYNDANQAAWASGSWGSGRVNPFVEMQNDGNLVIYHNGRNPLWASGTAR
ncbi:beta-1,3-glucanase family protein [Dactylosporangium cerinum]|uniref:Beta-1,3-glucanase family protein n=1 Tax=Dactylosporangium cerinum TaxID=1434730 RepID=A0ABV9W262_9ACTN